MELNELLQKHVNMSYGELLNRAEAALAEIYPYCQQLDSEYNGAFVITNILLACISQDGAISELECQFISELTGLQKNAILSLAKGLSMEKATELADNFADSLPLEAKAAMLALITAVLACDHRVTVEENKFLRRILA